MKEEVAVNVQIVGLESQKLPLLRLLTRVAVRYIPVLLTELINPLEIIRPLFFKISLELKNFVEDDLWSQSNQ